MSTIHVKYGLEFRPDLYSSRDRTAWLEAAGAELEKKGVSLKLGDGAALKEINTAGELKEFYERYESDPSGVAQELGIPAGRDIQRYISDLVQALDDIVKDTSALKAGTTLDLAPSSEMSKMLGLEDASHRYASSRTEFGSATRAEGSTSVLGIMLSRDAAPADPLEGVPHMDASTFEGQTLKSGRRSTEVEAVRKLDGLDKDQLIELLRTERGGKSVLRRIRKASDAQAFSIGYRGVSVDMMEWDSRSHSIREANPYVHLTIENGRFNADEDDGEFEVDLGTDYNEDTYYDTANFDMLENDLSLRARIRRDDATPGVDGVRRVLIQSKIGSDVDASGNKSAAKADIRKDGPSAEDIAGLDEDVRTGLSGWGWGNREEPIEAVGLVYDKLKEKDLLPDVGDHKAVLQLEAKAHIRSTRSRFHYDEVDRSSSVKFFHSVGEPKINEVLDLLKDNPNQIDGADAITELGKGILDKSAILDRVKDDLAALDPDLAASGITTDTIAELWPDKSVTSNKLEVKKRKLVADALKGAMDELAELVDDNRQAIAGSRSDNARKFDHADDFIDFMKSRDSSMLSITTPGPFIEKLDAELSGPNKDAFIEEFAKWANDEEGIDEYANAANKDEAMAGLRQNLVNEELDIVHRQLEAAGTAGQTLWFDNARSAYADNKRNWSNFLIDTFDVSEFYTPDQWAKLSDEQKAGAVDIDADKMYHAMVVNEVQIELGYEKPFTEAVDKAKAALDGARAGLFMDFAMEQGLAGVEADKPESFEAALKTAMALPEAERNDFFQQLNTFAEGKGSPLTFDAANTGELATSLFTTNRQGQSTDGHGQLVEDLSMSEMIWDTMLNMQEYIADLRGRRVKREAERAGFDDVDWNNSEASKGDTGLSILHNQ